MKRLRDEFDWADANEAYGAALLARIGPLQPSSARKARLRFALHTSGASSAPPRHRPALVLGVLMSATGASAMVGRFMNPAVMAPPAGVEMPASRENGSHGSSARAKVAVRTGGIPAAAPAPTVSIPEEALSFERATSSPERFHNTDRSRHIPKQTRAKVRPPLASLSDDFVRSGPGAALVIEAMEARRTGDLSRAADLLSEYQRRYPEGALQEEAFALSIETAVSRGGEAAPGLAAQYLARYPKGRFREQARRALKSILR